VALVATVAMVLVGMLVRPGEALAAEGGAAAEGTYSIVLLNSNGDPITAGDKLAQGSQVTFNLHYPGADGSTMADLAGKTVTLKVIDGVTVPNGNLDISGNAALASAVGDKDAGTVTFTFKSDMTGVDGGSYDLHAIVNNVDDTSYQDVTWSVNNGTPSTVNIIVENPSSPVNPVNDNTNKNLAGGNLSQYLDITRNANGDPTGIAFKEVNGKSITDETITYQLSVDSKNARNGLTITDTAPSGLQVDKGSFQPTLTLYDENGVTKGTEDFTTQPSFQGQDFTYDNVDLPANSRLRITYTEKLTSKGAQDLLDKLNADFDKLDLNNQGGILISEILTNNVVYASGGQSTNKKADIKAEIKVPGGFDGNGPDGGPLFSKESSLGGNSVKNQYGGGSYVVKYDENGKVIPQDVTYTLNADLSYFDGTSAYRTLAKDENGEVQNVIVQDALLPQNQSSGAAHWLTDDANFIAASNTKTNADVPLTKVNDNNTLQATPFSYYVSGLNVYVNLGTDPNPYKIELKAQITDPSKLLQQYNDSHTDRTVGQLNNDLYVLTHTEGNPNVNNTPSFHTWVVDHVFDPTAPGSDPVKDGKVFNKTADNASIHVEPGQSATVPFTFTLNADTTYDRIDVTKTTITDPLDPNIFDLSAKAVAALQNNLVITYGGTQQDSSAFKVNVDATGKLTLVASDQFKSEHEADSKQQLKITLPLELKPITGKQTLQITNTATADGADEAPSYTSSADAEATTFGNEYEVRKTVSYGNASDFSSTLRIDPNTLTEAAPNNFFYYKVEVIPHGGYNSWIVPLRDVLPAGLTFDGVQNANGGTGTADDPWLLDNNLEAVWDDSSNGIKLQSQNYNGSTGARISGPVSLIFRTKLTDWTADKPIINTIGSAGATVVPSEGYPILISKANTQNPLAAVAGGKFQVSAQKIDAETGDSVDDPISFTDATISNGVLVQGDQGDGKAIIIPDSGTYKVTVTETTAPEGYAKLADPVEFTVTLGGDGSQSPSKLTMSDDQLYAIGDYVWIDTDRDGLQGKDEQPLAGVKVTLTDADGKPVKDVFGNTVEPTETNAQGLYKFDNLPAGEYKVTFELTGDTARDYRFTTSSPSTESDETDSDALAADAEAATASTDVITLGDSSVTKDYSGQAFDATQGIDPTWDAGVVLKKVSVGDRVWWDDNADGIQNTDENGDYTEPGIAGVTVMLTGPDGKPVTDVYGNPVKPVKTDENGKYEFPDLPALPRGEHYTVTVDADADGSPVKDVPPTKEGGNKGAGDNDSSTGSAESADLTKDGDKDLTLDFGFVPSVSVGDYVWVDSDRDGRQDAGEPGIPDVVLTLVGPDGTPVTDIHGNPVGPVKTDKDGKYSFDDLPVLSGDQTYTVTIDQKASADALKPYVPTLAGQGDRGSDSSTWEVSTRQGDLRENGQRDPTLDFGFVTKTYAIGDIVWIDANKNGVQDPNEKPLAGITVELVQDGKVIATATTDKDGRYVFDDLPAGSYQVHFVLNDEQKKIYGFTKQDQGDDTADSDANVNDGLTVSITLDDTDTALTSDYAYRAIGATQGIDPTWDAGVVLLPKATAPVVPPVAPGTPATPAESANGLSKTGSAVRDVAVAALVLMVLGSAAGVSVVLRKKQRRID
jgi:DNA-directed RNA polymerase II subunit RPB1